MRLEGVGHVLAELIAAGAETRLVLSEKVGLLRQGWLEVKNNENLHEAETLSKRQSAQVFLPSNKIQTLSNLVNVDGLKGKEGTMQLTAVC